MEDRQLRNALSAELSKREDEGELVLISAATGPISKRLVEAAQTVVPHSDLTLDEMIGLRRLVWHAVSNKQFFDWEMPTLTGFTAEQFAEIAEKLPRD
jgi:hypothetical protein